MATVIEFYISDKERKASTKLLSEYFTKPQCTHIEKGIYYFTEQYCTSNQQNTTMAMAIYKDIVKNLLFNCQKNSRTLQNIIKKINKKEFNAYNLAYLRPDELDEDNWMKIILRKQTTDEKLNNLPTVEWKPCRICKATEYFFFQQQTRSADEPMTTFYTCKKCGKNYRFNN